MKIFIGKDKMGILEINKHKVKMKDGFFKTDNWFTTKYENCSLNTIFEKLEVGSYCFEGKVKKID